MSKVKWAGQRRPRGQPAATGREGARPCTPLPRRLPSLPSTVPQCHPPHLTWPQALHLSSIVSLFLRILITVSGLPHE